MTGLTQGGNAPVAGDPLVVTLDWQVPAGVEADPSCYLLTEAGRVRGDADMIFYNQPEGGGGAVRFAKGGATAGRFEVALRRLPAEIHRIVFCVTMDGGKTVAALGAPVLTAGEVSYRPELTGATEAAMILGELYRRGEGWKLRAVGQGFDGGLAPLARSFGIDVAEEPAAAAAPPPPPAPAPAPARPVSLAKISLDKPKQAVSLEKRGGSFGEIVVNLNWSRGKKGFFGGGSAIDLDLGCLVELADGGKGVVQALGRVFGAYDGPPWIQLSGDDRSGDNSSGETLRINGVRWDQLRRIAIFANIYAGVPNWQQTDGVVTVTMPDQPPIEVRMTEGRNDKRLCGIVLLENDAGRLKATRIVDYFRDQSELDRAFGWGMQWRAGSKD